MRSEWRDPDDITPTARRTARVIQGWRSFCPLRRMAGHPASGITAEHIMGADKLRELVDVAAIGYSGDRPLVYVQTYPQPRMGLSASLVRQVQAARAVQRAVRPYTEAQLAMIEAIILRNTTLRAWTMTRTGAHPNVEKGRLLAILDLLAQHFEWETADEVARGRRLAP